MQNATLELNNGVTIPRLGLGCYQLPSGSPTLHAVDYALEVGYRHFDTARMYANEVSVGEAVRNSLVPREEIFVTTKLWNDDHGYDSAIAACHESLTDLGLGYVDLYLIHWPVEGKRRDSWRALETLADEGFCRAIGVSNYMPRHLEELLGECRIRPAVNQVEFSPFLFLEDLLALCRAEQVPFVYDVHHHRCLADGLDEAGVTGEALLTWNREPVVHVSSPRDGWAGRNPRFHHDFIDPEDVPVPWLTLEQDITVEVEAKAKEVAVNRLRKDLAGRTAVFPEGMCG